MFTTGSFTNSRGQVIATTQCVPHDGRIKAVLHYHHGLGDYCMRNKEMFEVLASNNIATVTFDVHGHGNSEPIQPRFAIRSFKDVVADAEMHMQEVVVPFCKSKCPDAPVFLMGSSMGALATVLIAAKEPVKGLPMVRGIILNAAAIGANLTTVMRIQLPLAGLANMIVPNLEIVPTISQDKFCRDPEEMKRRMADTIVNNRPLRVCTACSMLEGFELAQSCSDEIALPVLALHGEKDEVCPLSHVEEFLGRVQSTEKELKRFPDGLHDLLHDYEKDEVRASVMTWIEARM